MVLGNEPMKEDNKNYSEEKILRQKAEELLQKQNSIDISSMTEAEILSMLHELNIQHLMLELKIAQLEEEKKQEDKETKYHTLLEFAPDAFFQGDLTGNLITVNDKAIELTGYSRDELHSMNISALFNSNELNSNPLKYVLLKQGETIKNESVITKKNGVKIQVEMNSNKMLDGTYQCYMRDITDRKKAEEALKESQQLFQNLTQVSPVGIFRTRTDGYTTFVNPRWSELSGLSFDEAIGYGWLKAVHPDDRERLAKNWDSDVENQEASDADYRFLKPDGSIVWVVGNAVPEYRDNIIHGYIGTITDITERKQAEKIQTLLFKISQAANYSQSLDEFYITLYANLKEVVNTDNLFIAIHNKKDDTLSFPFFKDTKAKNPGSRKFGNGLTEYVIKNKAPLLKDEKGLLEMFEKGIASQILSVSKSWLGVPLKTQDEIIGVLAIKSYTDDVKFGEIEKDILIYCSEQIAIVLKQKHNEELKRNVQLAEKTAQIKHQFLANMSHEMRTPMNGILGMVDFLLQTKLDEKQLDYAKTIKNSSETLLNLINDVLDLAKIEAGTMKVTPNEFNIHKLLNEVLSLFKASIEQKGLAINLYYSKDLPDFLIADKNRINQIINNLLSNAIKFTNSGSISIFVSKQKDDESNNLKFLNEHNEKKIKVRVEVKDTGIGISKENQADLFLSFSQIDSTYTRNYEGTGLGLAISKRLVELMGGEIGLNSEMGKGSTFWFTFEAIPISESSLNEAPKTNPNNIKYNFNLKVLLVEDKYINQKVITLMLHNVGCKIEVANNGMEALKIFEENNCDLILMDIQMPIMDGVTAVKELNRRHSKLPPIIGLSANAMEGDAEKYIAEGMDDYLSKPVSAEQLYEKIIKWTGKK